MGGGNFAPAAGEVILRKDQWQTIFTWGGFNPLAFLYWEVQIQDEFRGFPIEWRRWGAGVPPYWQGEFSGQTEFEVKPFVDIFISVEVRSRVADVGAFIRHRKVGFILFDLTS